MLFTADITKARCRKAGDTAGWTSLLVHTGRERQDPWRCYPLSRPGLPVYLPRKSILSYETPGTLDDEQPGRTKYGFGFNVGQPLADDGETGLFTRAGWANGTNSAWSCTEVDRHGSLGLQVSGQSAAPVGLLSGPAVTPLFLLHLIP